MASKVVITRPLAQAQALAQRAAASGREAVVFPLLEISPLPDTTQLRAVLANLSDYALAAFVSPNAVDAAFAHIRSWPSNVTIAVVGEGSRQSLARQGLTVANARIISPRDPRRSDSEGLLEALDKDALNGKPVLIVRGETGREFLADALRSAGARVTQVAAYRRAAPELDDARRIQLSRLIASPNDWIITSSEALRILMQMVAQLADAAAVSEMRQQRLIVPHSRIAETAQQLGFQNVTLTGSGDEQLLAALKSSA